MLLGFVMIVGLAAAIFGGVQLLSGEGDPISTEIDPAGDEAPAPADDLPTVEETSEGIATPSASATPEPGLAVGDTQTCSNLVHGFSLEYPSDWHTAVEPPKKACRFFSTEPVDASGSGFPETPIAIFNTNTDYQEFLDLLNDPSITKDSETETTVDGLPAVVLDLHNTDEPDDRAYAYIIDLQGKTLVLQVDSEDAPDFDGAKVVVDAIAASLSFQ